ncbi:mitogen-activated protein kinase-binding protein [Elysia marginata]|uniref:Mitogen-activated protein kinase-binding protein n=1 Tax=Elysia marginata TaxID=1093978 RepID=A0AAV4JME6_9GAST|nr:mitogen-activated protein kinase-binding protein [Elysia marginata]
MAGKLSEFAERSEQSYPEDKRGASQDEFVLERVQGLTSTTLHSLASNPVSGWVAFPAACVLVLLDPKTNEQKFIESPSLRNISCCAFTDDGRFVAFGETGLKPHIAMWNLREHKECHKFVVDTTVRAIFFHPVSPIIISLGLKDNFITVWDYVKGMRMASCKWQTMPLSVTIPATGSSLVVCGHRKITLFNISKVDSNSYETNVFQDRKTVLLGKQSEYTFVDVASGRGKHGRTVFTVTSCGYLCEIKLGDILIDKAIKVDTQTFCVRYNTELLFVGCPAGVVKICDPDNLTVTAAVSLSNLLGPSAMPKVGNKCYLDVCTLVVDENDKIVTCVYADCSMHSWQIGTDGKKIVCSAIEPGSASDGVSGHPASKSNLLRSFIGCCEKTKSCNEFLSKSSFIDQNKLPQQFGGRRLVNENRASYQNVNAVRFTPDGKDVICGNEEGEIKVYELSTGILRRVIEAHSSQVTCIELMYDNDFQLVCSGGRDRVMFVLDAKNDFSLVQVLCDHSAAITAISLVNHKGVLTLVSAAADNVILIRRAILGGTLRFTITGEIAQTNCSRSFFVTSDFIALGGKDSQIKVFKADPVFSSKPVKTINCQKLSPTNAGFKAIDIDPSSSFMAVSQCNGNISVYHLQTGQPVASLPLQSDIMNIEFTSDLKYMVSSTSNGCDLVWRLPERMTEFMQSKQEKIYQIETNKEVTSEAYMSCVKVCKEEVDEDEYSASSKGSKEGGEEGKPPNHLRHEPRHKMKRVFRQQSRSGSRRRSQEKNGPTPPNIGEEDFHLGHIAQNSSNHNSEWDRTPSIDSMSLLDNYRSPLRRMGHVKEEREEGEENSCSSCCSESMLSTCTHSVSTTTHTSCCSAMPTESSISAQHGRTEHSQQLRFYCGTDHDLFGQVIEDGHCIKLGPFREDFPAKQTSSFPDVTQSEDRRVSLEETKYECHVEKFDNADPISPVSEKTQNTISRKIHEEQKGSQNEIMLEGAQIQGECHGTDQSLNEKVSANIKDNSVEGSKVEDNLEEFKTDEVFEEEQEVIDSHLKQSQNISQNSDANHLITSPSQELRYPKSKKILEKTMFYEGVIRGDLKTAPRTSASSPTRQYTAAVGDAVRSAGQRKSHIDHKLNFGGDETKKKCFTEAGGDVENGLHWTPLTTPDYSNTSSNITNLVPSCSSTLLDLCKTSKLVNDINKPEGPKDINLEKLEREKALSPTLIESGDPTRHPELPKHNDCDATQAEGESFRSDLGEDIVSTIDGAGVDLKPCDLNTCCAGSSMTGRDAEDDHQILDLSINLGKINLNSETENPDKETVETLTAKPDGRDATAGYTVLISDQVLNDFVHSPKNNNENQTTLSAYLSSECPNEMLLGQEEESAARRQTVLDQLEQEGFTVPEKYRSALRSCMQLSNSQETFATLRVDTNDMELMAFLSHALKKKLVAAGLIGLSCNEIDTLLNSSAKSNDTQQQAGTVVEAGKGKAIHVKCSTEDEAEKTPGKVDQAVTPTEPQTTLEHPHNLSGNIGDHHTKLADVPTLQVQEAKQEACENMGPQCGDTKISAPRKAESVPARRPRSPIVDAKRKMYKSIMGKLPCARKINRNGSNTEAESDLLFESKIRSMIQASMRGEELNHLTHSDTYLHVHGSEENLIQNTERCTPENSSRVREKTNSKISPPRFSTHYSNKHKFSGQDQATKPSANTENSAPRARMQGYNNGTISPRSKAYIQDGISPRSKGYNQGNSPRSKGYNQGSFSSKHGSTRVISRSISSPGTSACREQSGTENTQLSGDINRRSSYCHAHWTMSTARTSEEVHGDIEQSRTESFVSEFSKDRYSGSDSGVGGEVHPEKPMVAIFRDQDEYLRKLKEVRENFERSIQALSAERKSRQAAEERGWGLGRK